MRSTLLLTLHAIVALALPAQAARDWCAATGPATGVVEVTAGGETFYVEDRGLGFDERVYLYQEANGEASLQRGGCSELMFSCDFCTDPSGLGPDRLLGSYPMGE